MNINKFTQSSMAAVQGCEKVAMDYGNQEVEQEHLLYALLTIDDSLILKLFEKLGIKLKNTLHLFMLSGSHQGLCSASIMVCLNLYCVYFKYPLVLE